MCAIHYAAKWNNVHSVRTKIYCTRNAQLLPAPSTLHSDQAGHVMVHVMVHAMEHVMVHAMVHAMVHTMVHGACDVGACDGAWCM